MDDKTSGIIRIYLRKWQGQVITKEMLEKLRDEIYKKTRKNKFAPFSNVKLWIKAVRKEMKAEEKAKGASSKKSKKEKPEKREKEQKEKMVTSPSKSLPSRVEASLHTIKDEVHTPAPPVEVDLPKAPVVFDKIYLQNIQFEIMSIRQMMERISRQLDKLERELESHRGD